MKFSSIFAAALLLSVTSTQAQSVTRARGGDVLEQYTAYISKNDLYNSRGERLTQPWQVIRQDRANYHAFGIRDRGDEGDDFFLDANNRERLERMVANGTITREAGTMLLQGNCWIKVEIISRGQSDSYLNVEVWR